MSFRIQPPEQSGILHNNRQHPGQRPEAHGADKNQPPDGHINAAQHVKQAAHQQSDKSGNQPAHNVTCREEREQQRNHRGGQGPDEDNRQSDADLREVVGKRPVEKVVPDEHPQQIAANLLQTAGELLAADAKLGKKPDVVK
jgi:hypothetical protein